MAVDMRHTKLSAEDAAKIAGELVKPTWASRNEGIHERVSFDDTLWGFELAGGAFYKTPLRVVYVKPGSRAEQACIRQGDTVLRINDIDTSTLTLQEAHDIVLESGIHLRISVTSPDDEVDAYYTYEDALADANRLAEELRRAKEAERIRRAIERANRGCNLPWPWVRRKIIIYRESNCFLVPSSYESKHKDKYPEQPHVRYTDDICEINRGTKIEPKRIQKEPEQTGPKPEPEPQQNGLESELKSEKNGRDPETVPKQKHSSLKPETDPITDNEAEFDKLSSVIDEKEQNKIIDEILEENEEVELKNIPSDIDETTHSDVDTSHSDMNGEILGPDSEEDDSPTENIEEKINEGEKQVDTKVEYANSTDRLKDEVDSNKNQDKNTESEEIEGDDINETIEEIHENEVKEIKAERSDDNISNTNEENSEENEAVTSSAPTSDFVEEDSSNKIEEENVVDGIVGDGDFNDSINER